MVFFGQGAAPSPAPPPPGPIMQQKNINSEGNLVAAQAVIGGVGGEVGEGLEDSADPLENDTLDDEWAMALGEALGSDPQVLNTGPSFLSSELYFFSQCHSTMFLVVVW